MTEKERNNGFELYKAFSEADSRFVDEMLDDTLAENIRAANKRRRIRLYSSFAAAAAVVVIAVGLNVFPRGSIAKNETVPEQSITYGEDKRGNIGAGENADGDAIYAPEEEKSEDVPMNIAPSAEADNAPQTQEMFDGEVQTGEEQAEEQTSAAAESSSADDMKGVSGIKKDNEGAAAAPVLTDEGSYEETPPDDIDLPDLSSADDISERSGGGSSDSVPQVTAETVALSDNVVFALAEEVSNNHRGRLLAEGDGFTLYSFDNCDPDAIVTVEKDGVYRAALRVGVLPDTLEELADALDLKRYLRCEGIEGSDVRLTDEQFRDEVLGDLLADGDELILTDSKPESEGITCLCRLGTDRETFLDGIRMTVFEDGSVYFTALGINGIYSPEE